MGGFAAPFINGDDGFKENLRPFEDCRSDPIWTRKSTCQRCLKIWIRYRYNYQNIEVVEYVWAQISDRWWVAGDIFRQVIFYIVEARDSSISMSGSGFYIQKYLNNRSYFQILLTRN